MGYETILSKLKAVQEQLTQQGVKELAVFGSVARGDSTHESDVDILVDFSRPVGLFEFIRLKLFLEQVTGCRVDLVTRDALRPEMRDHILSEAIFISRD